MSFNPTSPPAFTPFFDPSPDTQPIATEYPAAKAVPLPVASGVSLIIGGPVRLLGWSIREASGTIPARVDLISGANATGLVVVTLPLAPAEGVTEWLGPQGVYCDQLAMNGATGTVAGAVWVVPS